ncbi:TPA: hypothetical protein ACWMAG_004035 [Pseudomonas aeruginosa]|uniref:hypothetical protein n=1 Tax=Pseudomonas aeruginosa TaxID=287 RepID=UPI00158CED81|nr:hypothetical protein [Pseudomonas aeruginosa]MBI7749236.1 hypothetical protein [Pseudomonas aeruginosa]MCR3768235.1 hypothetical protein [Pseudomonas aeruginosa]MCR3795495.1 hypothetical protein [Pseudomonas aeruginosa]MCR3837706.1 hypothetical protein [Pseudomonas aeruginosa]MCV6197868.1 hypothetical protein [Pseudomonas aeruginosa]
MTESKICTCPSGDGSLVHPCPAHPAVEQVGGDERAAFELFVRKHCGMPAHIAVNWDAKFTNDAWEGWKARAALAQPSPPPHPASELDFSRPLETENGDPVKWICADVIEYKSARVCVAKDTGLVYRSPYIGLKIRNVMPEQAEAERPEGPTEDELEAAGLGYPLHKEEAVKLWYSGFRSEVITVLEAWEAIGHDIGMNPDKGELLDSLRYMLEKCEAHDAALAEVAGLRSLLNSLLCYVERDIDRMRSDRDKSDNKEIYDRSISLAMERLKAAQNAVFTTEPGCDTAVELAAQTTQAQHCVPEISGIGRDAEHPRAVVLYLRNEPSEEDMRAIQNFLRAISADVLTQAQHSVPVAREQLERLVRILDAHNYAKDAEALMALLAAAPAQAQHSVPEGWMLVECGIWTQEQVDEMQKTVARFRNSEFVDNRALAMAVADAGQCKAPEISLAELLAAAPGNSAQHSVPEGLALIPVRETEAMHDAVMALLYKGVARTDTQKLLDAYIAAAPQPAGGE